MNTPAPAFPSASLSEINPLVTLLTDALHRYEARGGPHFVPAPCPTRKFARFPKMFVLFACVTQFFSYMITKEENKTDRRETRVSWISTRGAIIGVDASGDAAKRHLGLCHGQSAAGCKASALTFSARAIASRLSPFRLDIRETA
jgi:hypothetical protein